jgi:hypothetical protein
MHNERPMISVHVTQKASLEHQQQQQGDVTRQSLTGHKMAAVKRQATPPMVHRSYSNLTKPLSPHPRVDHQQRGAPVASYSTLNNGANRRGSAPSRVENNGRMTSPHSHVTNGTTQMLWSLGGSSTSSSSSITSTSSVNGVPWDSSSVFRPNNVKATTLSTSLQASSGTFGTGTVSTNGRTHVIIY